MKVRIRSAPSAKPVPFKYPRAGRPNAIVDLGVINASGGEPKWWTWNLDTHPYLASVHWDHGPLSALVMNRDQTDVQILAFDPATGKQTTLLTEHDELFGLQMVELSGGRLKRGTVYVTLGRMQEKGYLESRQEPLPPGAIGLPRRLYRPTGFALRALAAWKAAEQIYLRGPEFQEG